MMSVYLFLENQKRNNQSRDSHGTVKAVFVIFVDKKQLHEQSLFF